MEGVGSVMMKGRRVWWVEFIRSFFTSRARDYINRKWDCVSVYHRKSSSKMIIYGMVRYHFIGCGTVSRSISIIQFTYYSPKLIGSENEQSYQCGYRESIQMATASDHLHHPISPTRSIHPISPTHSFHPISPTHSIHAFPLPILSTPVPLPILSDAFFSRNCSISWTGMELARRVVLCLSSEPSLSGYSPHFSNDQEL